MNSLKSTVIISVYKNDIALREIIDSLINQTVHNFEAIISEDGASNCIKELIDEHTVLPFSLTHLTQDDLGFRKNIALNRAITKASTDHLIFIDGDCLLHPRFISAHQTYSAPGLASSGRRLELGQSYSSNILGHSYSLRRLTNRFYYLINLPLLLFDNAKNIESGLYSKTLQLFSENQKTTLLGCNFSCSKTDLIRINGFNEDYLAAGTGEDSDIDWRLVKAGVKIKKVKFTAIQYHLYHQRTYGVSDENNALFKETRSSNTYTCINGLTKHT